MINADCRSRIGKWLSLVTGIYQTIVTACAAPPLLACPVFRLDFTGLLYEVICGRPVLADNLSHLAFVSSNNARTSRSRHSLAVPRCLSPDRLDEPFHVIVWKLFVPRTMPCLQKDISSGRRDSTTILRRVTSFVSMLRSGEYRNGQTQCAQAVCVNIRCNRIA